MATRSIAKSVRTAAHPERPETWPVIWRVVAPSAGCYDRDMVFLETEDEGEARKGYKAQRSAGWPVRIERVSCGPLPQAAEGSLAKVRSANAQNPGANMRPVLGYWERQS
jgi:hypothetical protein